MEPNNPTPRQKKDRKMDLILFQRSVFLGMGIGFVLVAFLFFQNSTIISEQCLMPILEELSKANEHTPRPNTALVPIECQYHQLSDLDPKVQTAVFERLRAEGKSASMDTKLSEVLGKLITSGKPIPPPLHPCLIKLRLLEGRFQAFGEQFKEKLNNAGQLAEWDDALEDLKTETASTPLECFDLVGEDADLIPYVRIFPHSGGYEKYGKFKATSSWSEVYQSLRSTLFEQIESERRKLKVNKDKINLPSAI